MEFLGQASEAEVVAAFLKAELASSRYRAQINKLIPAQDQRIDWLKAPDFKNKQQNEFRASILNQTRGWKNEGLLFENFPLDVIWHKVNISKADLCLTKYLADDGWIDRTNKTLDPMLYIQNASGDDPVIQLAQKIRLNLATAQPLIFLTTSDFTKLACVEGNGRLTAFCLSDLPQIPAIIGISDQADQWKYF